MLASGPFSLTCLPPRFKSTNRGEFMFYLSFRSSWYGVSYFILLGLDVFICEMGLIEKRERENNSSFSRLF